MLRLPLSFDTTHTSQEESPCCWICLDGEGFEPLFRPCGCPRLVHRTCMSTWQLQNVGKDEERRCRFCAQELPSWKDAWEALPKATPIMTVVKDGVSHQVGTTESAGLVVRQHNAVLVRRVGG